MTIRVSIIEDQESLRTSLKKLIGLDEGFVCDHAFPTGEEGVKNISAANTDVVLMDLDLPGMSGITATRMIKTKFPEMQIIILTVYENPDKIFAALEMGATGYLLKNTSHQKILESIKEVFNGGSPMSHEIARKVVGSFSVRKSSESESALLTDREQELLHLMSKGYRYKEIADKLFISVNTVRTHIRNIYEKLQVQSKIEAINKMKGNAGHE